MWRKVIWVSLVALLCCGKVAHGFDGIMFGGGEGRGSVDVYRIALRKNMDVKWLESMTGYLTVAHEFSLNLWREGDKLMKGIAWSPVFHYRFNTKPITPFFEFGIGLSYFSDDRIGGRNLSTSFLFEDRIVFGITVKDVGNILMGYMHYSNGGIKLPNMGIDILIVQYIYVF
ncbi:MAG: acyloxyacyl hydrolase [Chlorobiales bacterium]|nr:acyloxyacyl hydrolase [Chlorobiales bacterium]